MATRWACVTLLGLVLAALGVAGAAGALALFTDGVLWDHAGRAVVGGVASGAAFAVMGAGIGAALGNSAAALTGTYLTVLGVLPVLRSAKPELADKLDPASAIVTLAQHGADATPILVIAGWVVVSTLAGALITRRRAVA